jgi:hypothetical protein
MSVKTLLKMTYSLQELLAKPWPQPLAEGLKNEVLEKSGEALSDVGNKAIMFSVIGPDELEVSLIERDTSR